MKQVGQFLIGESPMDEVEYEILGTLGADADADAGATVSDYDPAFLANAGAEVLKRTVSAIQSKQSSDKTTKSANEQLERAIAADVSWATAESNLDLATKAGDANKITAAKAVADIASSDAMALGVGMSPDRFNKRLAAATTATKGAASAAMALPSSAARQALLRAWQKVTAAVSVPMPMPGSGGALVVQQAWYSRVPTWGWVAGGGALVLLTVLLARKGAR